jgi:hypothetical protein
MDELVDTTECFVGTEPEEHMGRLYNRSGLPFLLCNAMMGSAPGHPFWDHAIAQLERTRNLGVLESTGPMSLTGAALRAAADRPDVLVPDYWSPTNGDHNPARSSEKFVERLAADFRVIGVGAEPVCSHLWNWSWGGGGSRPQQAWYNFHNRLKWRWRRNRHPELFALDPLLPIAPIYDNQQLEPVPADQLPRVFIATPMKNVAASIDRYAGVIEGLAYPREKLSIGLVVSESADDTVAAAHRLAGRWREMFASAEVVEVDYGYDVKARARRKRNFQADRRAILARCRNALVELSLEKADFTLWVDADMQAVPADAIQTLLSARKPVVMANCLHPDGSNCDLNAFVYRGRSQFRGLYKYGGRKGLYQPPYGFDRGYLPEQTYLRIVPLHGVGGTTLLVDNDVFRAGVRFPEEPFAFHLETEGFGLMARSRGFEVAGLPELVVVHPLG